MCEKERADFHVHIGDRTSKDLLQEAQANQIRVLTVLDRGIVKTKQMVNLIREGHNLGITILPGVECLTEVQLNGHSISIEFLGLDFDLRDPNIFHNFDPGGNIFTVKHLKKVRFQESFLQERGFKIDHNESNQDQWQTIQSGLVLDTAVRICKIAASDPGNGKIFANLQDEIDHHLKNRPQDKPQNFDNPEQLALLKAKFLYWKHFAAGQDGFRKWHLDYQTILQAIHHAHGVVIIPHPHFKHKVEDTTVEEALERLFELGIDGVEGWDADTLDKAIARRARSHRKLILGGSGRDSTYYSNRVIGKGEKGSEKMFVSPRRLLDIALYKANNNLI